MLKKGILSILLLLPVMMLVIWAVVQVGPGISNSTDGQPAGFWLGLWHGLISPATLVISLFIRDVNVYTANNNGGWYLSGFILGLLIFLGAGNSIRKKQQSRRRKWIAENGG